MDPIRKDAKKQTVWVPLWPIHLKLFPSALTLSGKIVCISHNRTDKAKLTNAIVNLDYDIRNHDISNKMP